MSRNVGMSILRMLAVIGGVSILAIFILTTGSAFMPGTKIGHVFGASAKALAGEEQGDSAPSMPPVAAVTTPDAGTATDAGTLAAAPGGQGASAPAEAQALPEQQGR